MCILLYDERVRNYQKMVELDSVIEDRPELAIEMVRADIAERQAHDELVSYNASGSFLFIHPITAQRREYDAILNEIRGLKKSKPAILLSEITNLVQNIRRIKSSIKTGNTKNIDAAKENLRRAELRKSVLEKVLAE